MAEPVTKTKLNPDENTNLCHAFVVLSVGIAPNGTVDISRPFAYDSTGTGVLGICHQNFQAARHQSNRTGRTTVRLRVGTLLMGFDRRHMGRCGFACNAAFILMSFPIYQWLLRPWLEFVSGNRDSTRGC